MALDEIKCCRGVGTENRMIKYGKTKSGNQRYLCKKCHKTRVEKYKYQAYNPDINKNIILFTKEGLGIRSLSRVLKISTTTVLKRILRISLKIEPPVISLGKKYQVDEMRVFIKRKDRL